MSKIAGVLDADRLVCVAQRRCEDLGVSVEFSHRTDTAYTDGARIVLPVLAQPVTQEELDTLYGYLIHETGHHLRPDAFKILKSAQPPDHVCAIYNIIEDDGMERERAMEWRGDKKALSITNNILISRSLRQFESIDDEDRDLQPPEPLAAMTLNQLSRLDWDDESEEVVAKLITTFPASAQTLIGELLKEDWIKRMREGTNPHDTWDIALDLAKRLYPDNPEEEYEEIRKAGHEQEYRNPDQDSMGDARGKKQESTGEPDEDKGNSDKLMGGEDGDNEDTSGEGKVVSWKDCVLSEHNEWAQQDGNPGSIGIDWSGKDERGVAPVLMPTNLINVVDLSKSKANDSNWNAYMPHNEESRAFANRIRRYIQAEARSTVDKEKYHGRLDKSALVRLAMPPIDKGEYNKKIFYDQRKHTMKDTAIFVLTDWSGSMMGSKMRLAADASQRLVHVFERILKVPVALAAFSDSYSACDIGYIKPYNTRGLPPEEIARRFAKFYHYTSANNDADALHWAWKEIASRKEARKILIVLSDGCPAGQWGRSSPSTNLKYITKQIEKEGRVELYGVGIISDAVESYYTNCKLLDSAEQINETLFNIIKEGNHAR